MAVDLTRSTCSVCELPDMQDIWAYVYVHTSIDKVCSNGQTKRALTGHFTY